MTDPIIIHPDTHPGAHLSLQTIFRYYGIIDEVIAAFENLKALQPGETTPLSPTPLILDVAGSRYAWDLGNVMREPAQPEPVPLPPVPVPNPFPPRPVPPEPVPPGATL